MNRIRLVEWPLVVASYPLDAVAIKMPVFFKLIGPSGEAASVPISKIGNSIASAQDSYALRPIIDTLHISVRASLAHQLMTDEVGAKKLPEALYYLQEFWAAIWKRLHLGAGSNSPLPIKSSSRRIKRYRHCFDIFLHTTTSKPLLCLPAAYSEKKPPLLMIINIDQLALAGLEELEAVWNTLVGDLLPFRSLLLDARVSRLDTAIDILNVPLPDLYLHHEKLWKIWAAHHPTNGVQSIQYYLTNANQKSPFSDPKKRSDLIAYDKRAEQLAKGQKPRFEWLPHTRIERSQHAGTLVRNIQSLKPNFEGWTVARIEDANGKSQDEWRRYVDSVRVRGLERAASLHTAMPVQPAHIPALGIQDVVIPKLLETWDAEPTGKVVAKLSEWANLTPEKALTLPQG